MTRRENAQKLLLPANASEEVASEHEAVKGSRVYGVR